jgi:flavorubredoxin
LSLFSTVTLYDDGRHAFYHLGWEEQEEEGFVQTNQYLIRHGDEVTLLDPGGAHVFPRVLANVAEVVPIDHIRHIFYSHQDPDVSSGVTLWLPIAERAKVYISGQWTRFLPHFGVYDARRIVGIPDGGSEIALSDGTRLPCVPSHFLHSVGQFSLYDPIAKILFSGDIGAAIFPPGSRYAEAKDFDAHVRLMEGFHKRYMASNAACRAWVDRVSSLPLEAIAPQHGAVMRGETARRFLGWLRELRCGTDLIDQIYGGRAGRA